MADLPTFRIDLPHADDGQTWIAPGNPLAGVHIPGRGMDWDKLKAAVEHREGEEPSYIPGCSTVDLARLALAGKAVAEALRALIGAADDMGDLTNSSLADNAIKDASAALAAWDALQ